MHSFLHLLSAHAVWLLLPVLAETLGQNPSLVDIIEPKCDMTGLSGQSLQVIYKFIFCRIHVRSKCFPIFRKVTREQNWMQRGTWWESLRCLCAAGPLPGEEIWDLPSAQLCFFQILELPLFKAVDWSRFKFPLNTAPMLNVSILMWLEGYSLCWQRPIRS